jgi:hypothetical protein
MNEYAISLIIDLLREINKKLDKIVGGEDDGKEE